ncbi:hypothetical protein [Rahnella inusitata]|uniref:hypothetical protein n=1 Tax=Rahnella inusitata TaxID=58169 RepID=UPI0039B0D736
MVNPLLFNMFTGMNVALLNQGIEKITRRAYARLVLIYEIYISQEFSGVMLSS